VTGETVTAVIPTHGRPELVCRAVDGVRAQTAPVGEIVVVVDGADSQGETLRALSALNEPRLTVVAMRGHNGPSRARNAGVAASKTPWVAFCDDDDLWQPHKMAWQLKALDAAGWSPHAVVSTGVIGRSPSGDYRWPARFIAAQERVGDYLFCTRTPFQGETLLHTSSLLASRELLRTVPFDESLWNHEDWDWLLRAEEAGARLLPIEDHLVIWHIEEGRDGLGSRMDDWERSYAWARQERHRLGARAFSAFCLTVVAARARAARSPAGIARAFLAAMGGRPSLRNLRWFPLYSLLSPDQRRRLRSRLSPTRPAPRRLGGPSPSR
jgi:glycosyltransferase involved in cell wall biosynthesis